MGMSTLKSLLTCTTLRVAASCTSCQNGMILEISAQMCDSLTVKAYSIYGLPLTGLLLYLALVKGYDNLMKSSLIVRFFFLSVYIVYETN